MDMKKDLLIETLIAVYTKYDGRKHSKIGEILNNKRDQIESLYDEVIETNNNRYKYLYTENSFLGVKNSLIVGMKKDDNSEKDNIICSIVLWVEIDTKTTELRTPWEWSNDTEEWVGGPSYWEHTDSPFSVM